MEQWRGRMRASWAVTACLGVELAAGCAGERDPIDRSQTAPTAEIRPSLPAAEPAPAQPVRAETTGETDSETGGTDGETGGADSETGANGSEAGGARLCSRALDVSSTPGKGSSTPGSEPTASEYKAARARLAQGFTVSIGDQPAQPWTPKRGVEFDGLDPEVKHQIDIRDSKERRVKAMVLDFERRGSDDLCMGLDSFYGTWQLRALRPGTKCGACVTRPRDE